MTHSFWIIFFFKITFPIFATNITVYSGFSLRHLVIYSNVVGKVYRTACKSEVCFISMLLKCNLTWLFLIHQAGDANGIVLINKFIVGFFSTFIIRNCLWKWCTFTVLYCLRINLFVTFASYFKSMSCWNINSHVYGKI